MDYMDIDFPTEAPQVDGEVEVSLIASLNPIRLGRALQVVEITSNLRQILFLGLIFF